MEDVPTGTPAADDRDPDRARDERLVEAALSGDERAFGQLYDAWFDRVFNLAFGVVRDREVAAEVAQDAFLSAWKNLSTLENTDAFGGWLLRIARNASFNRQKKEARSRPVDDEGMAVIEQVGSSPVSAPTGFGVEERLSRLDDPEQFAADGEMVALVRESAAALGERDAEVLDLQLRFGLSPAEIGEVIGVNRNAANQLCHRIRKRFATAVQARVLWNGARPACDQLDALLRSAGVTEFDAEAVRLADKHAPDCDQCSERREMRLQPAALFASVPLVAAPVLLKAKTAAALEGAGVPMGGSAHAGQAHVAISLGDGRTIDGAPGDDDQPDEVSSSSHRVRRALVMGGVALVLVLIALVAVLADRPDDGVLDGEVATASGPSRTSASSSTTTSATPPSSQAMEIAETLPDSVVVPPGPSTTVPPGAFDPGPAFPTPQPPAPTDPPPTTTPLNVAFSLSPSSTSPNWVMPGNPDAPRLVWVVHGGGADTVRIRPPGEDNQEVWNGRKALLGSALVCPGFAGTSCAASQPGAYDYRLEVFDGAGNVIAERTVRLTIL
jgi:RNA polymerase sigma factor (sigma-70 family)